MPRRGPAKIKITPKDPIYAEALVQKLILRTMRDGKKSVAQKQVYGAFEIVKEKSNDDPMKIFDKALSNIRPEMEVRPRRVGGAAYQVPMPVKGNRKDSLAIRWLIEEARKRSNSEFKTFAQKLASEIVDAANGEGGAVKKRETMERQAEANKAFAHFRW